MIGARTGRSVAAASFLLLFASCLSAQAPVQITEFPTGGNPIPITVGPDGNFWTWFSGGPTVGRLTPTGTLTVFQTALEFPSGTPGHCVNTHDGHVWCSNTGGNVVRIAVLDGSSTVFTLPPNAGATDLTFGPDGALWFTDSGLNQIGRLNLQGAVTEYPVPASFVAPHSITIGPDGALWFTSEGAQLGRLDTTGGGFQSFNLPDFGDPDIQINSITVGPDGNFWICVGSDANKIVRASPSGQVTEFPLPTPLSEPLDVVAGPDSALWFTEEGASANKIGRITTNGTLTEYSLPQPLSGPVGITVGRDGAIWFTELAGRIGRLSGGPLAIVAVPTLAPAVLLALGAVLAACGWLLLRSV
jgi:virginiamycin B lyase